MLISLGTFDIVAVYAAVVSTVVAVFEIYKHCSDRAYLRIEVSPSVEIFMNDEGALRSSGKATIRIFNDGRRACTIYEVGYVWRESILAKIYRIMLGRIKFDELHRHVKKHPINFRELPKKLEPEDLYEISPTWRSFFFRPYGAKVYFYAKDTMGRVRFTEKYYVNYFKDPFNEDIREMVEPPFDVDEEEIRNLNIPLNPEDWMTWGIKEPWWKRLWATW